MSIYKTGYNKPGPGALSVSGLDEFLVGMDGIREAAGDEVVTFSPITVMLPGWPDPVYLSLDDLADMAAVDEEILRVIRLTYPVTSGPDNDPLIFTVGSRLARNLTEDDDTVQPETIELLNPWEEGEEWMTRTPQQLEVLCEVLDAAKRLTNTAEAPERPQTTTEEI